MWNHTSCDMSPLAMATKTADRPRTPTSRTDSPKDAGLPRHNRSTGVPFGSCIEKKSPGHGQGGRRLCLRRSSVRALFQKWQATWRALREGGRKELQRLTYFFALSFAATCSCRSASSGGIVSGVSFPASGKPERMFPRWRTSENSGESHGAKSRTICSGFPELSDGHALAHHAASPWGAQESSSCSIWPDLRGDLGKRLQPFAIRTSQETNPGARGRERRASRCRRRSRAGGQTLSHLGKLKTLVPRAPEKGARPLIRRKLP